MSADHGSWPVDGFCRVLPQVEINAGDPYILTVELMNVIGWQGVNSGHPGVFYNVIDKNNFDLVYFRLVLCLEFVNNKNKMFLFRFKINNNITLLWL